LDVIYGDAVVGDVIDGEQGGDANVQWQQMRSLQQGRRSRCVRKAISAIKGKMRPELGCIVRDRPECVTDAQESLAHFRLTGILGGKYEDMAPELDRKRDFRLRRSSHLTSCKTIRTSSS
jgi:hypothetical protein